MCVRVCVCDGMPGAARGSPYNIVGRRDKTDYYDKGIIKHQPFIKHQPMTATTYYAFVKMGSNYTSCTMPL